MGICSKGSTTGLAVHLKSHHKEVYQEFKQKKHEGSRYASENGVETNDVKKVEPNINLSLNSSNESINTTESETSNLEEKKNIRSEKLVLAGDDFGNDLMNVFKELANDEDFTNVTLVTDDGRILKAHKVVLSSFSPFFKTLLLNNVHQHPLLYLRGVQYEELKAILDFIYLGQTKVEMHKVTRFIDLATDLQIKGLRAESEPENVPSGSKTREYTGKDIGFAKSKKGAINKEVLSVIKKENASLNEPSYTYACHLCEYQADKRSNLIKHMEILHTEPEGTNPCNQCDFQAANNLSLM